MNGKIPPEKNEQIANSAAESSFANVNSVLLEVAREEKDPKFPIHLLNQSLNRKNHLDTASSPQIRVLELLCAW